MDKTDLNRCINVRAYCQYPQNQGNCTCWLDYNLWCKDEPKMTFDEWKAEALKQYEAGELAWRKTLKMGRK